MNNAYIALSGKISTEEFDLLAEMTEHLLTEEPPLKEDVADHAGFMFKMDPSEEIPSEFMNIIKDNNLDAMITIGITDLGVEGLVYVKLHSDGKWDYCDAYEAVEPTLLVPLQAIDDEEQRQVFQERHNFVRRKSFTLEVI